MSAAGRPGPTPATGSSRSHPTTGQVWGSFVESGAAEVDAAVHSAQAAFNGPWGALSPTRRGRLMRWGEKIAENAERVARLETSPIGKPVAEMRTRTQPRIVMDGLNYFGGLADRLGGPVIPLDRTSMLNYTVQEPLGVVAAVVP